MLGWYHQSPFFQDENEKPISQNPLNLTNLLVGCVSPVPSFRQSLERERERERELKIKRVIDMSDMFVSQLSSIIYIPS
jgi:hypothetical protein